jgi:hypothetical protein
MKTSSCPDVVGGGTEKTLSGAESMEEDKRSGSRRTALVRVEKLTNRSFKCPVHWA